MRHCQATPTVEVRSLDQLKEFLQQDTAIFPDSRQTIVEMIAEGNLVGVWGRMKARSVDQSVRCPPREPEQGTGAEPLAIYAPIKLLEGKGPVEGVALIEFPDMESASRWYESAAYQALKQYRVGAADVEVILVDGGAVAAEDRKPHTKRNVRNS